MSERAANVVGKVKGKAIRAKISERKARAFRAYLDVLDTAAWFRYQVETQLADFDLNLERFRLLEMLYRDGPMTVAEAAKKRCCARQSLFSLAERLGESGWVEIQPVRLPAVEVGELNIARSKRDQERLGRRAANLRLTEEGENFMAGVLPRHEKLVYALMRAIDPREMDRLSRTCRKIREGDVAKLIKELMMEDVE
jgi:DNA-binding MarR family transcriptional regulator